jgi:hypothetical protein
MNLAEELRKRFPWLENDEQANGADTVDAIVEWYEEICPTCGKDARHCKFNHKDEDDDEEEEPGITCTLCQGELQLMGVLGSVPWYRCRNCGMESRGTSESDLQAP